MAYPNLEMMCRLCLTQFVDVEKLVDIFPQKTASGTRLSIPMRVMACIGLEIQAEDELPKVICNECRFQLEKSYYFKKRSQGSDSKLRKHIRLLNLGKKSNVFVKNENDSDDDDELEFADSIQFIKERDELRSKEEQRKLDEWKEKIIKADVIKIQQFKAKIKDVCKNELRQELEDVVRKELRTAVKEEVRTELRDSVRHEIKEELRGEVEIELGDVLRADCVKIAKLELRQEVVEECRQEELKMLLNDLECFLKDKRVKRSSATNIAHTVTEKIENNINATSKALKRSVPSASVIKKHKLELDHTGKSVKSEIKVLNLESQQTPPYEIISSETSAAADGEETESNFYILGCDGINEDNTTELQEQSSNSYYNGDMEGDHFNLTTTDNNKDTASYQLNISEMRFFKKGDKAMEECGEDEGEEHDDVIVFNYDGKMNDGQMDSVEFVQLDKNVVLLEDNSQPAEDESDKPSIPAKRSNSCDASDDIVSITESTHRISDTPKTFKCSTCDMAFSTQNYLTRHLRTHRRMEEKGVSYQCPECHLFLSCSSALKRHMLIHTGSKPFTCHCGKSFIQREILKRHMLTHSDERPHKCHYCDRTFRQKVNLRQHINKNHMEIPKVQQHSCHLCPKRFDHASGLSRHLASHSGLTFQCSKCERNFADRSSVKRHVVNVHCSGGVEKTAQFTRNVNDVNMKNDENSTEF